MIIFLCKYKHFLPGAELEFFLGTVAKTENILRKEIDYVYNRF